MASLGMVILGIVAGIFGGLLGIGGGTIVVPGLVYFFGMSMHKAQGTILAAFLPPVALLAVWKFYQTGNVDVKTAALVAAGIFLGSYFGAMLNLSLSEVMIKRIFGVFLITIAVKFIFGK